MKTKIAAAAGLAAIMKSSSAYAICPVCTVAVGAWVGLSRYFGIDDTITGVWVGGLTVSLVFWTIDWFERKKIDFPLRTLATYLAYYAVGILPLFVTDVLGHPANTLWGIDKLLLGIAVGSVVFFAAAKTYLCLKAKNGGKAHFPFEKVVLPVAALSVASGIFYYLNAYVYVF